MPSDIRSFFGGNSQPTPKAEPPPASKKRSRGKKVVDDEDDELEAPPAKKPTPRKKAPPAVEDTTAEDYFGKGKPKRSAVVSKTSTAKSASTPQTTPKKVNGTNDTPQRSSARSKKAVKYETLDDDEDFMEIDAPKTKIKSQAKLKEEDEEEYVDVKPTDVDEDMPDPEPEEVVATKSKKQVGQKRKSIKDEEDETPKKKPAAKTAAAKKQKTEAKADSAEMKAILNSIPTIEAPPPPEGDEKPKFKFNKNHPSTTAPAGALDMNEIPSGAENCLAGLQFVFTGQLQKLGREQGQNLVKQYGGKVQTAPSKKTSYVVLGEEAGPKKLAVIKEHNLKVINEDGLFALISKLPANGGDSAAAEQYAEKQAKETEKIRQQAEEIEKQERAALSKPKPVTNGSEAKGKAPIPASSQLWTVRYAPQAISQICGNKGKVEKLQRWLKAFPKNQRTKFKLPGPDGSGTFRAVMIHGPPGIGKTTAAHLVAKLEGYDIVETNASDTRSKKLVENGLKGVLSTTSLMGYFSKGVDEVAESKKKLVLIMDEVDGMSAGDRGGVGALAAVCKKSQIPMILICNERKQPKMKPFDFVTYDLGFIRPTTDMIRSRIMTIAFREQLKMPVNVINALIEGSGADIRQVVNMISTAKLDSEALGFEESKDMSKAWEKHVVLKPWDMVGKILRGDMFNPVSKHTLNDKQELYFNDHELAPLMLQENYLSCRPTRANRYQGQTAKHALATLQLFSKAADSISDGDLIDRMIHGSQQQWSLMPAHAMASFVRPASFVYGGLMGQTRFAGWLGKNSSAGKLSRFVKEIQGHMRLRTSADRFEIRQTYVPTLFNQLVKRLEQEGKDGVEKIIEIMDYYYLTKDDFDAIQELGVGNADMEKLKTESAAKAAFTRQYNQMSHPLPFIKASQVTAPKKGATKAKPDLEEAMDDEDDVEVAVDDEEVQEEDAVADLSKDKYVKQPKKKRAPAKKKGGDEAVDEEKQKKGKGRAKK